MEQLLALEMIRVTEAAAIASARSMGRGDRDGADQPRPRRCAGRWTRSTSPAGSSSARASATRRRCSTSARRSGRAPRATATRPRVDIAVDPLEGTNLVAHGQAGAITVLAASETGGLTHAPDTYMEKLCVGPVVAGKVDIRERPTENLRRIAEALGRRVRRHHGRHPRAAAPRRADRRGPRGRRADQAHRRRRPVGGDLVRRLGHRRPRGDGHRRRPGGRHHGGRAALPRRARSRPASATAATTSASAARGWATATRSRVYRTEDLAPGENLVFAATGVTAGDLLQGVRFFGGGARTHSLVMAYQTKQVRFVDTVHMFDRDRPPRVRL